jgi:hypothetical protein
MHLAVQGLGDNNLLDKGLKIDKALAVAAGAIDLSIGHT